MLSRLGKSMNEQPKIYLVHALDVSMAPVEASFRAQWPEARIAHLLENSLFADFGRDGKLTDAMIERFRLIGRYCAFAGADAILFTCSAFGPAIEAVKRDQPFPVLKPNEALYDDMLSVRGRIALLATFRPSLPSMMAEIESHARAHGVSLQVEPHLAEGALDALLANRPEEHDRIIAETAARFEGHAAVAFAQFSMAPAREAAQSLTRVPIMTTPDSAIAKLKRLMAAT
jgi:hypothetical protein